MISHFVCIFEHFFLVCQSFVVRKGCALEVFIDSLLNFNRFFVGVHDATIFVQFTRMPGKPFVGHLFRGSHHIYLGVFCMIVTDGFTVVKLFQVVINQFVKIFAGLNSLFRRNCRIAEQLNISISAGSWLVIFLDRYLHAFLFGSPDRVFFGPFHKCLLIFVVHLRRNHTVIKRQQVNFLVVHKRDQLLLFSGSAGRHCPGIGNDFGQTHLGEQWQRTRHQGKKQQTHNCANFRFFHFSFLSPVFSGRQPGLLQACLPGFRQSAGQEAADSNLFRRHRYKEPRAAVALLQYQPGQF